MTCEFDNCQRVVVARKLCRGHYAQRWRGEELGPLGGIALTPEERLAQKVSFTPYCWEWTAAKNQYGYGKVRVDKKYWLAHRYVFTLLVGEIPAGMMLDHKCHNRACVNPMHLQVASQSENQQNRGANTSSGTGVRGVSRTGAGRFSTRVKYAGSTRSAGTFDTLDKAEAAVIALRNELFTNNLADRSYQHGSTTA